MFLLLVRFKLKENSTIFFEKENPDILPIIAMVKEKVAMRYLLDLEGKKLFLVGFTIMST